MIIRVSAANRQIEIDDPQDFKAFSVRIEGSLASAADQAALLNRASLRSDREHTWISEQVLREWPSLAAQSWWQEGLSKMIAAVQPFGWIDQTNGSIRTHIEYAP